MIGLPARTSVVMLTYNRREEVLLNLGNLRTALPGVPITLVDNCSTDGTAAAVRTVFPDITVLRASRNMGAAGRNLGVRAAATPYVAFCDDDTCWAPEALIQAEQLLDAWPQLAILSGRVLVGPQEREDPTCEVMACSPLGRSAGGLPLLLGFMAGACVVRAAAFLDAGGYNPHFFIGAEEGLLSLDLIAGGWQIAYAESIVTRHYPSALRDGKQRSWLLARNAIWTAWMRLPADCVWRETRNQLSSARRHSQLFKVLYRTLCGLPWVCGQRRVVPNDVAAMWRCLHQASCPTVNAGAQD